MYKDFYSQQQAHLLLLYLSNLHLIEVLVAVYFAQRRHSTQRSDRGETITVQRDIVVITITIIVTTTIVVVDRRKREGVGTKGTLYTYR